MRDKFITFILIALFAMPILLRAEEMEIQLMEVVGMGVIEGDNPLDDPEQSVPTPPRPTNFRATINGNTLSIEKREAAIPSAQAIVVNAATGGVVVNAQFSNSVQEQISNSGTYVLRIETVGGALVGQFIVQ